MNNVLYPDATLNVASPRLDPSKADRWNCFLGQYISISNVFFFSVSLRLRIQTVMTSRWQEFCQGYHIAVCHVQSCYAYEVK